MFPFPDGKRFAFTILDDTDVGTVSNLRPMYELLDSLGMKATKTVWPMSCPEGSRNFSLSQTLDDPDYLAFVLDLQSRGFEIASHGATMESSSRERTRGGLEKFEAIFGGPPKVYANHAENRECLYWGPRRIDLPFLGRLYCGVTGIPPEHYVGHVEGSEYFWGDLCVERITYVRNLTFSNINTAAVNPSMPYRDPSRPWVPWWFSASDAEDAREFAELICPEQQESLEREGGVCIVATHFGKRFVDGGDVVPLVRQRLERLASRPGWFPTVGELLDTMRARRTTETLPAAEWRRMQLLWARDLVARRLAARRARRRAG